MNTSFTWDILSLKKYPQVGVNTNVVYQAKWRVTGICTVGSETKTAYERWRMGRSWWIW